MKGGVLKDTQHRKSAQLSERYDRSRVLLLGGTSIILGLTVSIYVSRHAQALSKASLVKRIADKSGSNSTADRKLWNP
jgi:uncharacterized membrane protein YczE